MIQSHEAKHMASSEDEGKKGHALHSDRVD